MCVVSSIERPSRPGCPPGFAVPNREGLLSIEAYRWNPKSDRLLVILRRALWDDVGSDIR